MKKAILLSTIAALCCGLHRTSACTGIALSAADGSYVQSRTIEWSRGVLRSQYVVIPRGQQLRSFTPTGANGLAFTARYGTVGLAVEQQEFIAEGINEAGLSAGLFFFPQYGGYESYDPDRNDRTLADLQVAAWMLTQFATIDEVKAAVASVRIVALEKSSVVHWRIGEASGRQVVLEIVDGVPHFYENEVGILTNAPGFEWQLTNLDNYVNLYPGDAPVRQLSGITLRPTGSNSGFLGIPGDATPPSRFVRAAFYRATAPQRATAFGTVLQCFHLLNCFDIPIGIDHPQGDAPDIPSATQWTSAIDLTHRRVYYKTAYDNSIRYTDHFLAETIAYLRTLEDTSTALLYCADHGEDLIDDDRERFLHASPTTTAYQLYVASLAWFSDAYRRNFPEKVAAAEANETAPATTHALFHTMADMASLEGRFISKETSLVNSGYDRTAPRRYLNDHNEAVPFRKTGLGPEDMEVFRRYGIEP